MNVNFLGVMVAIYSSLKLMKENPGSLVFSTSSSSAMYGMPGIATYSATKHAVKGENNKRTFVLWGVYFVSADPPNLGAPSTAAMQASRKPSPSNSAPASKSASPTPSPEPSTRRSCRPPRPRMLPRRDRSA